MVTSLKVNWWSDSSKGIDDGNILTIPPGATVSVNVESALNQNGIPPDAQWGSISYGYEGREGELIAVASSYSKDGRYGIQSPFNSQLTFSWKGGAWHSDSIMNSLIAGGNGGDKPPRALMKLRYIGGEYEIGPRLLNPGDQFVVDVGDLISKQVSDNSGRVIPLGTFTGTYSLEDIDDPDIGNLYEGKLVIDRKFGHATYGCSTCCGESVFIDPTSLFAPTDTGFQDALVAQNDCTGLIRHLSGYNWNSQYVSVATVSGQGYVSHLDSGQTYVSGTALARTSV